MRTKSILYSLYICRGESYLACVNKAYPYNGTGAVLGDDGSGIVQTAWAVLGLMASDCQDATARVAIDRGIQFIMKKQVLYIYIQVCVYIQAVEFMYFWIVIYLYIIYYNTLYCSYPLETGLKKE